MSFEFWDVLIKLESTSSKISRSRNYLGEFKLHLTETQRAEPKQNLSRDEQQALNELKQNNNINLKKADKGSTSVVMKKTDKIK